MVYLGFSLLFWFEVSDSRQAQAGKQQEGKKVSREQREKMSLSSELSKKFELDTGITELVSDIEKLSIEQLTTLKGKIEAELDEHICKLSELEKDGNTSLGNENYLIDGFPRGDLDLISIKFVRRNIVMLKNDLEKTINALFEKLNSNSKISSSNLEHTTVSLSNENILKPFIKFSEIVKGSPSEKSGLQEGDRLISMNELNFDNYKNLEDIKRILISNINKDVTVKILRYTSNKTIDINLVPTNSWNGQGILGCKITEMEM